MSFFRAIIKFILFFGWLVLMIPPGCASFYASRPFHKKMIYIFFNGLIKILGIKVKPINKHLRDKSPKLYVSNHTSYIDIFILGSFLHTRFTPKIEVSSWLFINFLVNLSLPLYIHRNVKRTVEQKMQIRKAIDNGDSIVIFPEATTNNGRELLPFKSSLFSVAEPEFEGGITKHIAIQPISIIYTRYNGKKVDQNNIDKIAWHGDMTFLPHLWDVFKAKKIEAEIVYHQKVFYNSFTGRKSLAEYCHNVIEQEFEKYRG